MTVSIANMSQVWMSNTNTYNAIAMSVSTMGYGANAKSKLLNLSVDGNSKFSVYTNGSLYAPGAVVQVVSSTVATQTSTTSQSMVSTGLSQTITPKSSTSKILVSIVTSVYVDTSGGGCGLGLFRSVYPLIIPAPIFIPSSASASGYWGALYTGSGNHAAHVPLEYLDSPSSTYPVTYHLYFARYSTGITYINYNDGVNPSQTTITLMEIAQ